jgi:hypothetical protein
MCINRNAAIVTSVDLGMTVGLVFMH